VADRGPIQGLRSEGPEGRVDSKQPDQRSFEVLGQPKERVVVAARNAAPPLPLFEPRADELLGGYLALVVKQIATT
jgi:hypothetical protein